MKSVSLDPIGYIESEFTEKFGIPRQGLGQSPQTCRLRLRPDLQPELSLESLSGFSHLWLIGVFHKAQQKKWKAKVRPPRFQDQSIGVFATRSPHRPNPISLTLVEIVSLDGPLLTLKGCDLLDGTPILDIKPYLPEVESVPQARRGWLEAAADLKLSVEWSSKTPIPEGMEETLRARLSQDPRPRHKRKHQEVHGIRIGTYNVVFQVVGQKCFVLKVEEGGSFRSARPAQRAASNGEAPAKN